MPYLRARRRAVLRAAARCARPIAAAARRGPRGRRATPTSALGAADAVRDVLAALGWSAAAARRRRRRPRALGVPAGARRAGRRAGRRATARRRRWRELVGRARRAGRRPARARPSRASPGLAARRQGPGVGRGVPGRPDRGAAADQPRRDAGARSRRSAGCSTSASPGPASTCTCPGRRPARPAGAATRKPSRFLDGLRPATTPRPAPRPGRRTGRRPAAPAARRGARRPAAPAARPCSTAARAQGRPLPTARRPTTRRSSSGCARGGSRTAARGQGPGVRRLHRRHADGDRRDGAGRPRPSSPASRGRARPSWSGTAPQVLALLTGLTPTSRVSGRRSRWVRRGDVRQSSVNSPENALCPSRRLPYLVEHERTSPEGARDVAARAPRGGGSTENTIDDHRARCIDVRARSACRGACHLAPSRRGRVAAGRTLPPSRATTVPFAGMAPRGHGSPTSAWPPAATSRHRGPHPGALTWSPPA